MGEYICEVCGKTEELSEEEAFQAGWDYPPFIGAWGIVSPRTCGDCGIEKTLWFRLIRGEVTRETLTAKDWELLERIHAEGEAHGIGSKA